MREKVEVGKALRVALTPELKSVDEENRTITFVASDESVDRYGDVIRVSGWNLDAYKKNPVVLWGHDSKEPPIGRCIEIHTESNPPALVQTVEFADAATYPFAATVFNLFRGGFMRAVSVGFMPLEQPNPIQDLEGFTTGYEFTSQELLELSCVPIPANQNALARAIGTKSFSDSDLARAFSGKVSNEAAYKEICSASLDLAEIAVDVATKVVREAIDKLKTPAGEKNGDFCTFDQLLDAVKGASALESPSANKTGDITTLDALAEALKKEVR